MLKKNSNAPSTRKAPAPAVRSAAAKKHTEPLCPHRKKCGGCQLQNLPYEEQLHLKMAKVIKLLGRFHRVEEIIGMESPYHYRNKVQAAFGTTRGGKLISGIFQSSSHRIVAVDACLLEDKTADAIIVSIRKLLPSFKLTAYNEDTHRGFLRHVLVKRGFHSGEVMVVLVGGTNVFPRKKDFVKALLKRHPEITTIVFNINDKKTSLVLGERQEGLYGSGKITDSLLGCRFRISPKSFYQINPTQTEVLYAKALEFADLQPTDELLDAYCGIGTIGLIAAGKVKNVIGVELNKEAVKDARENAKLNGIQNAAFYCADAGEFMLRRKAEGLTSDVVIMDPPRAGASKQFLHCLVQAAPKKVVYVSCNPETQQRDLLYLVKNGYKVKKIQPVDMFPHTEHVETVVLLRGEKVDGHVEIDLDVDKPGRKSGTATYTEIKAYIEEKYGFKVSTLYIAQMKDKVGMEKRKNYNPGEGKSKVPVCTPEKEEAIMDAFRHFNLI